MSIRGKAFIVGAFEHPDRVIPDRSIAQIHAEMHLGALADAGLALSDIDGLFAPSAAAPWLPISMADYLGLTPLVRRRTVRWFVDPCITSATPPRPSRRASARWRW